MSVALSPSGRRALKAQVEVYRGINPSTAASTTASFPPTYPRSRLVGTHAVTLLALAGWLGLGAGCAGISDARHVSQRHTKQATEFKNAWGPVSKRTSDRVLADLKKKSGDLDILERQAAIEEEVAGTPLVLGNKVTVLLDGPETYAAMFKAMRGGGVKIYERRATLLHAKTVVIDGVWSCVGSANLDSRSAVDNDEVAAVVLSREFGGRMVQVFVQDQAQSDEIKLEEWKRRSWRQRTKEWVFRLFARLL